MLELKNVTKSFSERRAVDDVSFCIEPGEVVGFLGPNGAGKTTTMRMIATLLEPDEGEIVFNKIRVLSQGVSIRQKLGYMPEDNPLYSDMMVFEYLSYIARLKGIASSKRQKSISHVVAETGIGEVFYRPIGELSKGYKQRVGLAQAIIHQPDLLILDEPTEGLDPNQRVDIRELIKNLGNKRTVVLSTHVLQEVAAMCNRLIIINQGRIIADGTTDELVHAAHGRRVVILEAEGLKHSQSLENIEGVAKVIERKTSAPRARYELLVKDDIDVRPQVFDLAVKDRWRIWELHQEKIDLEHVFRELTKESSL